MVRPTKLPWKRDPPVTWVAPKREPSWRIVVSPRREGSWRDSVYRDGEAELILNLADSQGHSSGRWPWAIIVFVFGNGCEESLARQG